MPRNGSGIFAITGLPTDGESIDAIDVVSPLQDLEQDANTVRPLVAGGTGGNSPASARAGLELGSMATQNSTNVSITGGGAVVASFELAANNPRLRINHLDGGTDEKIKRFTIQDSTDDVILQDLNDDESFKQNRIKFDPPGTDLSEDYSAITREKGDARYAQYEINNSTGHISFPVGQVLLVQTSAAVGRREIFSPRLGGGNQYLDSGAGALLSGTWRSLGPVNASGTSFTVAQRVA